jgi:hypothetical protein
MSLRWLFKHQSDMTLATNIILINFTNILVSVGPDTVKICNRNQIQFQIKIKINKPIIKIT